MNFAEKTWEEIRDLDREKTVLVLPVGAVEAHGPHLPLCTDVVISEAMARAGAELLEKGGWTALVLPSLHYTAAEFAAGFPGTVSLSPDTVTATILDVARSAGRHGFRLLAIANSHLDPVHLGSLQKAVDSSREEEGIPIVFPNLALKPWASRLTEEFKSGACHAGRYETSVVLAAAEGLVREAVRSGLPAVPASLSDAILKGRRTFEEAGGERAYFGYPAQATPEEGRETIAVLGRILEEAVLAEMA